VDLHLVSYSLFQVSWYLVPRNSSLASRRASFFNSALYVPSGMERLSASTNLATGERTLSLVQASEVSHA
jgi:hypothetical protein